VKTSLDLFKKSTGCHESSGTDGTVYTTTAVGAVVVREMS